MLATQDLSQMQEHLLQILPQLLRQNPEIATTIEGMLAHQFPRRDEFIQLLNEMKLLRENTDRHFEQVDKRLEQIDRRFEQVEKHLDLLEQRFEQVDRRFEQVDKRLDLLQEQIHQLREDTNRHFEQVDKRLDLLQEQIHQLREDTNRRFEQVDRRFEQVEKHLEQIDRRFEQVDRRFEQVEKRLDLLEQRLGQVEKRLDLLEQRLEKVEKRLDLLEQRLDLLQEEVNQLRDEMNKRFELLQTEMERRFEEMNKRFELLQAEMEHRFKEEKRERLDMKRRLIKVEATVERMEEKITQFDAWLKVVTGNIGDKRGQEAEQLFALGLSYGLKRADIKPETIQLRQMFRDDEGIVFPLKGKYIEVDILAENGQLSVFEVKITAIETDVVTFARKVQLIQHQNQNAKVNGIFISPDASEVVKQCCAEYGLMFVG